MMAVCIAPRKIDAIPSSEIHSLAGERGGGAYRFRKLWTIVAADANVPMKRPHCHEEADGGDNPKDHIFRKTSGNA